MRVLVERVEDDVGRDHAPPSSAALQRATAASPSTASGSRISSGRGSKISDVDPAAIDLREREAGHVLDLGVVPSASRRRRAGPTPPPRPPPASSPRPERAARAGRRPRPRRARSRAARPLRSRQRPGRRQPERIERPCEQQRDRGRDKRGRDRLGVEVEPDVDVPLAVLPGARSRRAATSAAATPRRAPQPRSPTAGCRSTRSPMNAVATIVTAFATIASASPTREGDVVVEQADDPEREERDRPEERPADDGGPVALAPDHEVARRERRGEAAAAIDIQWLRSIAAPRRPLAATSSRTAAAPAEAERRPRSARAASA